MHSAGAFVLPASIAVAFAGFSAAVVVAHSEPETPEQPVPSAVVAKHPQPLSQHGTVVAVTPESITARSVDGFIQTYRVTSDTTVVTTDGGQSFVSATPFAVNDEVAIQATVAGGTATATAVADRAAIGQHGVPMDYV